MFSWLVRRETAAALLAGWVTIALAQPAEDWPYYGRTQAGLRYSTLTGIDRDNVADLQVAWTYRTGDGARYGEAFLAAQAFEATPTLVAGALIVCTPSGRLVALDPASGAERWSHDPNRGLDPRRAALPKCRGVAQWTDRRAPPAAHCSHRIVWGTWAFRAYAVDARTGRPCTDFGTAGEVVLDPGRPLDADEWVNIPAPPAIAGDLAIFGSSISDSVRADGPRGTVRALDVRTGALRWTFEPVPADAGDPAAAGWEGDSARRTGHANVWTMMAVDTERDLVFLPTSSAGPDYFGGTRPGDNRYANSLVALRASTGEVVWHFQTTHHDVWDYDLPAQPILIDLPRDGATVPAVVQLTKQGLVFVFHRETGAPLFPIEERAVPSGGVDGERLSPTQPFPVAPPPLVAQGVRPDDAWGVTFIDRWLCRRRIEALRHGSIYTPPSLEGTIYMPSFVGGANWGGGAYDPVRNLLLVSTLHAPGVVRLLPRRPGDDPAQDVMHFGGDFDIDTGILFPQRGAPYRVQTSMLVSPLGMPCVEPPWGRLTAVDLARGTIAWQVPLGSLDKLLPVPLPLQWGTPHAGGAIVTAGGLVFIGATIDDRLRAFDVQTGELLWAADLPAGGQATPMTYSVDGRQYLVIAAGGHALFQGTPGDYVIAFALPQPGAKPAD